MIGESPSPSHLGYGFSDKKIMDSFLMSCNNKNMALMEESKS
jgi:hypothetical protein